MTIFAVTYEYGVSEAELDVVRPDHRAYLRSLPELVLSGPWADGPSGALLLFDARDEAHAVTIVEADPIVKAGCVSGRTIRPWNAVNGRWADQAAQLSAS